MSFLTIYGSINLENHFITEYRIGCNHRKRRPYITRCKLSTSLSRYLGLPTFKITLALPWCLKTEIRDRFCRKIYITCCANERPSHGYKITNWPNYCLYYTKLLITCLYERWCQALDRPQKNWAHIVGKKENAADIAKNINKRV